MAITIYIHYIFSIILSQQLVLISEAVKRAAVMRLF